MEVIIDGRDFWNFKPEKYWTIPKNKNPHTEVRKLVFSGEYTAARKIDGQWHCLIKDLDGNFHLRSRGESVKGGWDDKVEWIPHITSELSELPNGTVLLGEIYLPEHENSKNVTRIMSCLVDRALKRQEEEDMKLHFYIFDLLAAGGKDMSNSSFEARITMAQSCFSKLHLPKYVEMAKFYEGQRLWEYIGEVLESGGEGVVLQSKEGIYNYGKRTAWKTCKVKKEIGNELDLFITGRYKVATKEYTGKDVANWTYWQHMRTYEKFHQNLYDDYFAGATIEPITKGYYYGWAGSIELGALNEDGKVVPIAWISNLTEDVKKKVITGELNKQVVKVTAMEIDKESGNLRHAKITEFRNDIDWTDCTTDKIYNDRI